jgi:hypothetical protein
MGARKHAKRIINRRRAKRVAVQRELHEINEWLVTVKDTAEPKEARWTT